MKNVKKLLKKAMVFTVAASMLVGTPLTASAAGIRGVYSVSDGTENEGDSSYTGTVTNTDTNTNSGVIKDNDAKIIGIVLDKDYVNAEKGVKETLKASIVIDGDLVDGDKTQAEIIKELESKIKWEVTYVNGETVQNNVAANKVLSIAASAADRTKVTLNPRQGTEKDKEMIVKATIVGSWGYYAKRDEAGNLVLGEDGKPIMELVELKDNKTEDYTAKAKVSIKEYSDHLVFDGDPDTEEIEAMPQAYLKHTLDLNDYLVRTPKTANDTITWISSDTKVATVTAAGMVTFKKVGSSDIYAVGEKGVKDVWKATVEAGMPASKVVIIDATTEEAFEGNKTETDLGDQENGWRKQEVDVIMYAKVNVAVDSAGNALHGETVSEADADLTKKPKKVDVKNGDDYVEIVTDENGEKYAAAKEMTVTDTITWTSNKPAIVEVKAEAPLDFENNVAVLKAKGIGKAAITAKASNGKSSKLNVTVKATLNELNITEDIEDDLLYSGQSHQMVYESEPVENKDSVKWSIDKVEVNVRDRAGNITDSKMVTNPNATINAKGLLTIKPKLTALDVVDGADPYAVTIRLQSKTTKTVEKDGKNVKVPRGEDTYTIYVEQSSIDGITVTDDTNTIIADVRLIDNKVKVNDKNYVNKADNTTEISVPKNRTYTASVMSSDGLVGDYEGDASILTWKSSNPKVAEITPDKAGNVKITAKANGTATVTVSGIRVVEQTKNDVTSIKSAGVIKTTFKVSVKQPVKTVTLNKPSVVLNQKNDKNGNAQNQKVALKATLGPKGVNKKEAVHWSVKQNGTELEATKDLGLLDKNGAEITKASVSVNLPTPHVGDVFEITARTNSGASATSTVTIVNKTTSVAIAEKELDDKAPAERKPLLFRGMDGKKEKDNVKSDVVIGGEFKMYPCINIGENAKDKTEFYAAGENNCENVTYSVNKKGIVSIDSDGTVHAINKGTVTITAKTPLGKKATLKVIVGLPQ